MSTPGGTPDLPDYSVAQSGQQYSSTLIPLTGSANLPTGNGSPCPSASSLVFYIIMGIIASVDFVTFEIAWTTGGVPSGYDEFVLTNAVLSAPGGPVINLQVPCKGDAFTFLFSGLAGGPPVAYKVAASSRVIAGPIWRRGSDNALGTPLALGTTALAAGASSTFYLGPFTSGLYIVLGAGAAAVTAQLTVPTFIAGAWVLTRAGSVVSTGNVDVSASLPITKRAVRLVITNNGGASVNYQALVLDVAA